MLICGHHRVEAARRLSWKKIRVWVRSDLTDQEAIEERLIDDNATVGTWGRVVWHGALPGSKSSRESGGAPAGLRGSGIG